MAGSNSLAALYPSGLIQVAKSNASTTLTASLGSLLNSDGVTLFDAKSVTIVMANVGTGQTINAASLSLYDTLGNQNASIAYAPASVSIANNTNGSFVVQLTNGILKNTQLSVTFASAPTAGSVVVQAVFHETGTPLASATTGYVSAYGSNAAALTSSTDYSFKWGAAGTTLINHVMIQNNTSANLNYDLDTAANAGSPLLAPGQTVFFDVQTTAVHLWQAGTPNVNGSSAANIVVRGWS